MMAFDRFDWNEGPQPHDSHTRRFQTSAFESTSMLQDTTGRLYSLVCPLRLEAGRVNQLGLPIGLPADHGQEISPLWKHLQVN